MDLVKNLLKSYYFYTLPSDVRCSTDVRSFLIARMSGHFWTSGVPQQKHFYGCPELSRRPTLSQQKHFYGRPDPPVVRAPDVRPSSDVRILYTGLWLTFSQRPVVRWLSDVRTYLCLRTSDVLRTSSHPVPQTVTFSHHLYIHPSLPRDRVDHSLWASQEHSSLSLSFIHTKS